MHEAQRDKQKRGSRLGWGLGLIGLGAWFLLIQLDVLPGEAWHTWWPFAVIAVGMVTVATAKDPKSLGSGVTTIGMGLWFSAAVNEWYGLEWHNSWPLALVAGGLGTLVEWAASVVAERRHKGDGHES